MREMQAISTLTIQMREAVVTTTNYLTLSLDLGILDALNVKSSLL